MSAQVPLGAWMGWFVARAFFHQTRLWSGLAPLARVYLCRAGDKPQKNGALGEGSNRGSVWDRALHRGPGTTDRASDLRKDGEFVVYGERASRSSHSLLLSSPGLAFQRECCTMFFGSRDAPQPVVRRLHTLFCWNRTKNAGFLCRAPCEGYGEEAHRGLLNT